MPANFLRNKQVINIRNWHPRKINVGYGTRDKVVFKQTKYGKVYFLAKTYDKDIGELRSEVCASVIGRFFGFPVQKSWLCDVPQYTSIGLRYQLGVLIQLDVRRQKYAKRKQFREDLVHGAALIAKINKSFENLKSELDGRKIYTLDLVVKALRAYVITSDAKIVWEQFFELLVFDALIGGTDRHYNNWGVLVKADSGKFLRLAPAFDNGVSLLWKIDEYRDSFLLENLKTVDFTKRARSMFKKTGGGKYTLYDVLDALYSIREFRNTNLATRLLSRLNDKNETKLNMILRLNIPQRIDFQTDGEKLDLICAYVRVRLQILKEVLGFLSEKYD